MPRQMTHKIAPFWRRMRDLTGLGARDFVCEGRGGFRGFPARHFLSESFAICLLLFPTNCGDGSAGLLTMVRGRKISTDLKYTILASGGSHPVSEIVALTAVSRRQIHRIRKTWEATGCVEPECVRRKIGRPRFLTGDEEAVCFSFIP